MEEIQAEPKNVQSEELLEFFKALADRTRLKIVGLLAVQDLSVEQMAAMLDVRSPTVSHHLQYLQHAGLVSARAEGYYNIYHLDTKALEGMASRLLVKETLPSVVEDVDMDAYDRKVLKSYLRPDGTLREIPMQQKKLLVILRYAVEKFEPGKRYTEKQVTETLAGLNEDSAFLRRALVDFGFMKRQGGGGEYWREEQGSRGSAGDRRGE